MENKEKYYIPDDKGALTVLEEFRMAKYRIEIEAGERGLNLPPYKGSTLRGGFGSAFLRIACAQRGKSCKECLLTHNCPYSYIFETSPPQGSEALRNYENVPRPFVLEPPLETQVNYAPGDKLIFNLLLFGKAINYLPYFIITFQELGEIGIGKGRGKYRLKRVQAVNDWTDSVKEIYDDRTNMVRQVDLTMNGSELPNLIPHNLCANSFLTLNFVTMTRLKYQHEFVSKPEFHIVLRNLLRRLSSLYYFHHGQPLDVDYQGIIARAEQVELVEDKTQWVDWERYSSRQDSRMNLGGIVGSATYNGDIRELLPLIFLGQWTHVGKAATFGMGKYEIVA